MSDITASHTDLLQTDILDAAPIPCVAVPYQSDIVRETDVVLEGIERLLALPPSSFLWQQAFQTAEFLGIKNTPYFLLKLDEFLEGRSLPHEFTQTLAEACAEAMLTSPCAARLARRLPRSTTPSAWAQPELYAASLLTEGAEYFFHVSRSKILALLQRTAREFRHSRSRQPWDYVFTTPQFAMIRNDTLFQDELASFLERNVLPCGLWLSLSDAYSHELSHVRDETSAMGRIKKAADMALILTGDEEQRDFPRKTFSTPMRLTILAALAIVAMLFFATRY